MEEGRFRFGFFGRLVGNDIIFVRLEKIERLIAVLIDDSQDKAALEAALAKLREADTTIDNIEPTQGVPQ